MLLTLFFGVQILAAQKKLNLGFESTDPEKGIPNQWFLSTRYGSTKGYVMEIDSTIKYSGNYSLKIASDPSFDTPSFAPCSQSIPAEHEGKTISLQGYIKTENVGTTGQGAACFWLRLDGDSGIVEFDNMNARPVTGTTDWQQYRIDLPLNEEAKTIIFGAFLAGTGTMWIDDLEILIDGKPLEQADPRQITVYPAQLDSAFVAGSDIDISSVNERQIRDLTLLGQVWGFLKYHHPAIAAGKHHWDFELFRILPQILDATEEKQRDQALISWINRLGDIEPCEKCNPELPDNAKILPDLQWMEKTDMLKDLRKKLQYIYQNRNQEEHYYISLAPNVENPQFQHEEPYAQFDYPDAGYRLLALFRYWNIIHYFFPYKNLIEEDWNAVLTEFVPRFVETKDALDYRLAALEIIGRIHDTHANLWMRDQYLESWKGNLYAPVQVKFIEDQAVVTGYYHDEWGLATGLKPGDVITAIDGEPVSEIVRKKEKYHPASNYPTKLRDIVKNLLRGNEPSVEVSFKRNEKETKPIVLKRFDPQELNLRIDWAPNQPDSCYRLLNEDIGYLYLGNIKSDLLPTVFETFKNTKGIIIDIRNYPSEFVVFSLGRYLMPKPAEFVKFSSGDIHTPGLFEIKYPLSVGEENADYYKGKVVILINEISQSQAEYTTMAFRVAPKATVIGSTTAGADGNVSSFFLPGGLRTMISGIGVYYPDGTETQRVGIVPDIEVKPTIEGIRAGRDELLEKAMKVILSEE
jgi:C-terminal processing protease CtpA/Prc